MNKNQAGQTIDMLVIDTGANLPKTGDAANLTLYIRKDDGAVNAAEDTTAAEVNAVSAMGLYSFAVSQGESNANKILFSAVSTTPGVRAVPREVLTVSGSGSPVFTAVVVARIATGSTAGWPADLTIGDAYLVENASAPILFIKDVDDNILAGLGTKLFSDGDFVGTLRLAPLTDGTRTLDSPPTTIEVKSTDSPGIVYNDYTVGAEYFELQILQTKTLLGVTKTRYSCQFIMNWGVDETFERTVNLGEIKFLRKNAPVA